MIEPRHKCSYCSRKRNESKMYEVFYPLLHKEAWHCIDCYDKLKKKFKDLTQNITILQAEIEEKKLIKEPFTVTEP